MRNRIITKIDEEEYCLTFATHGDYLFYSDDSSKYQIGDVILFDGSILNEDDVITLIIQSIKKIIFQLAF